MAKSAEGWAVVDGDVIDVKTVSPDRRSALVNWLVVQKNCLITTAMTDAEISMLWASNQGDAICTRVRIETAV